MGTIVAKFGGSSTASGERLRRVGAILRANPDRRCAVLSAPGTGPGMERRITDLLEEAWQGRGLEALDRIVERFRAIAAELGLPDPGRRVCREILEAASVSREAVLSRGEYLCAKLFARWAGLPFRDAADVIRFLPDGSLDEAATLAGFRGLEGAFILPGFYGADESGAIHTFPRNGSDITGALAAAGLKASVYENWTDVDGLMTADPAVVPGARPIPRIGYAQMAALSKAGARVLHPDCLSPVRRSGIPTHLRNTLCPDAPGTWIDDDFPDTVPCVAGRPEEGYSWNGRAMASLTVFGARPGMKAALVHRLQGALVAEDETMHRFLVDASTLAEQARAAHDILTEQS